MSILGIAAFLPQSRNQLAAAVLAASSVRQSSAIRQRRLTRSGYGQATLAGPYTGDESALIEVEITSATGSSAVTTAPVFAGAGNGTLDGLTVAGATPAQSFTVTLKDLGTTTTAATLDLGAARLRAVADDAGGNDVFLTVDTSGLSLTAQNKALLAEWPANTQSQTGDQWDFGGLPLLADGTYNTATPAIAFGTDPQIFRPHKEFVQGQWVHHLTPAPPRNIPRGTNVYTVAGSMEVTVSDGVTPETYPGITTVYSLMTAIAPSLLVRADSVVVDDRSPGGMGAAWLSLRTSPFVLPPIASGSKYASSLDNLALGTAPYYTEEVVVECADNERIGQERWSVTGTVSGAHADAYTDYAYSSGPVGFTIPLRPAETTSGALKGEIAAQYIPLDTASTNRVCIHAPVVGALGADKTIKFVWTERPVDECPCETASYAGAPSEECLGLPIPETQNTGGATVDPTLQGMLDDLYTWLEGFIDSNTAIDLGDQPRLAAAVSDVDLAKEIAEQIFAPAARLIFSHAGAVAQWGGYLTDLETEFNQIDGTPVIVGAKSARKWLPTTRLNILGSTVLPTVAAGRAFVSRTASSFYQTGASEPAWPTVDGGQVIDGNVTWEALPKYWESSTSYPAGHFIYPHNGHKYESDGGGASGATEPHWSTAAATVSDGAITWTRSSAGTDLIPELSLPSRPQYLERWKTKMSRCLVTAGIDPKSDGTPLTQGGACWTDTGAAAYWADPTGYYLPMFNGVYYTSARLKDGVVVSTKEFGLAPVAGCEDKLQPGDELIITISGAGTAKTYQVGDKFNIPVINAGAAYLTGGITGNDTHTWGVVGTVAGALPDYAVVHGAEVTYADGGLGFTIYRGGIANALGDKWIFDVLGGQFRWRRDGGVWSAAADIDGSATSLGDGLALTFTPNKSPSYVATDQFSWDVIQPYAPSEAVAPSPIRGWEWIGATATLTADLGSAQPIDAVGLVHRLPAGATATISGSSDNFATTDWSEPLDISARARVTALSATQTSRYIRISLANADGGQILWAWAGMVLQHTQYKSISPATTYSRTESGGLMRSRKLRGVSASADLEFTNLTPVQLAQMRALLAEMAEDDAPILFVPNLGADYQLPHVFGQLGDSEIGEELFRPGAAGLRFRLDGVAV